MSFAFCVLALPRSGSTWVANWLTSGHSMCWHDPLEWAGPAQIELLADQEARPAGFCCTGMWLVSGYRPRVPTVKLWRDPRDVNASMRGQDLPEVPEAAVELFDALPYRVVTLRELLDPATARDVQAYLLPGVPFDGMRHRELVNMNVQPTEAQVARVRALVAHYNSLKAA